MSNENENTISRFEGEGVVITDDLEAIFRGVLAEEEAIDADFKVIKQGEEFQALEAQEKALKAQLDVNREAMNALLKGLSDRADAKKTVMNEFWDKAAAHLKIDRADGYQVYLNEAGEVRVKLSEADSIAQMLARMAKGVLQSPADEPAVQVTDDAGQAAEEAKS